VPEGCKPLVDRPIEDVVKSTVFCAQPDALLVYGLTAGRPIDNELIPRVKAVVDTPVFASNGVREDSIVATLTVADGCIVGTWLKVDGKFFNETDEARVSALMKKARKARGE
jgi:predicted TIM-barrel enzyme